MVAADLKLVGQPGQTRMEDLADDDLMLLVAADRQDAFDALVRRHQGLVLGLATRFFADRAQGREVAQDVFLALWAERRRYRPKGKFSAYLCAVSRNRCRVLARSRKNRLRKRARLAQEQLARPAADDNLPVDALLEAERARLVREKLTGLPEKVREVLVLRYTHELPMEEIAALTGLPVGTVKSHVFRGLKRLGRSLSGGES